MSAAVQEAQKWANALVLRESRSLIWALRYRPPKDILMGAYLSVRNAYLADCERQKRLLEHEIAITKAALGNSAEVEAAEALVEEMES